MGKILKEAILSDLTCDGGDFKAQLVLFGRDVGPPTNRFSMLQITPLFTLSCQESFLDDELLVIFFPFGACTVCAPFEIF